MSTSLELFPDTARVTVDNHLAIGGADLVELASVHGTPLQVFDSATVVARAGALREALHTAYPGTSTLAYTTRTYVAPWVVRLLAPEGIALDVRSAGELDVVARADVPLDRVYLHGNNKTERELAFALDRRVGRVVVDSLDEIALLGRLARPHGLPQAVLLSLGAGAIGLDMASGAALAGARAVVAHPALDLVGFTMQLDAHGHGAEMVEVSIDHLFACAAQIREAIGFVLREVSVSIDASTAVETVAAAVLASSTRHGPDQPELTVAVGLPLIARAGVGLHRVVSVKKGAHTYVSVDGEAPDHAHAAVLASRIEDGGLTEVTIVAADGSAVVAQVTLPLPHVGDLIAAAGSIWRPTRPLASAPGVAVVGDGAATMDYGQEREPQSTRA